MALASILLACGAGPPRETDAGPSASALPTPDLPGRAVRPDDVTIDETKRVLSLSFVGSPEYEPTDPCANTYTAEAELEGDELEVAIWERSSPLARPFRPMEACAAVGFQRSIDVVLPEPFHGSVAHDRSGYTFFVARPMGLAELTGLGAEWRLTDERDVEESRTGRWVRVYARVEPLPDPSAPNRLDFYQAFDGPVNVSGGQEAGDIEVNGRRAKYWTWAHTGELVINWSLEGDGFALVANEADFSIEELARLAESVRHPDS